MQFYLLNARLTKVKYMSFFQLLRHKIFTCYTISDA